MNDLTVQAYLLHVALKPGAYQADRAWSAAAISQLDSSRLVRCAVEKQQPNFVRLWTRFMTGDCAKRGLYVAGSSGVEPCVSFSFEVSIM
jgi:hypothetical protein